METIIEKGTVKIAVGALDRFCCPTQLQLRRVRDKGERQRLRAETKYLRKELRQREDAAIVDILKRANVILATLTTASNDGPLGAISNDRFDLVVIDECSQVSLRDHDIILVLQQINVREQQYSFMALVKICSLEFWRTGCIINIDKELKMSLNQSTRW